MFFADLTSFSDLTFFPGLTLRPSTNLAPDWSVLSVPSNRVVTRSRITRMVCRMTFNM